MVLPETDAQKLLVRGQSVVGVRTGDKGLDRDGQPLGSFEPGVEVHAQTTVLSEGTQGHLAGALFERFRIHGEMPQVWSLGVKEVWRVDHPLDRVVHTLGWPFRLGGKWKELGGSFIYPMGEDMLTIGLVCGLDYARRVAVRARLAAAVQDAPADPADAGGRRADRLGREDDPRGRIPLHPPAPERARRDRHRRQRRVRQRAEAEGHPLRDALRDAGRRDDLRGAQGRRRPQHRRAHGLRRAGAPQPHLERPAEGAQHAPGARQGDVRRGADRRDHGHHARRPARRLAGSSTATPRSRWSPAAASTRRPTAR